MIKEAAWDTILWNIANLIYGAYKALPISVRQNVIYSMEFAFWLESGVTRNSDRVKEAVTAYFVSFNLVDVFGLMM